LFFKTILNYAFFAFILNLIREIAKDIEDIEGDKIVGMRTLPIVIGATNTNYILFCLSLIPLIAVVMHVLESLYRNEIAVIYFLLFIIGPLVYLSIKIFMAKTKKDYHHISNVLKMIMLFGVLSLLLYKYI